MADLVITEHDARVRLSLFEKAGALHRDLVFGLDQVLRARRSPDMWRELRGLRAPGTWFPGIIMLGTTRYRGGKDFCAVYRNGPGVVIDLGGHEFSRILLSCKEAENLVDALGAPSHL
jgi:hypothetical protein